MIRRYISWRNRHARDRRLGRIVCGPTLPDTALLVTLLWLSSGDEPVDPVGMGGGF
jgi:uncharacterized membrane protein SirB2